MTEGNYIDEVENFLSAYTDEDLPNIYKIIANKLIDYYSEKSN